MRKLTFVFAVAIFQLFALFQNVYAQSETTDKQTNRFIIVEVESLSYNVYRANFDTEGISIGGLSESALKEKFTKFHSVSSLINFVARNGYEVVSYSPRPDKIYSANGLVQNGYTILFKQTKQ